MPSDNFYIRRHGDFVSSYGSTIQPLVVCLFWMPDMGKETIMNVSFTVAAVYVCTQPVDLRKGVDSLADFTADQFGIDPHDHSLYIFTNRAHNRLKCLLYDGTSYWMFYRKLNSGRFNWNLPGEGLISLSEQQYEWLMAELSVESGTVFPNFKPVYY